MPSDEATTPTDALERGRRAADERNWGDAYDLLSGVDAAQPLDADDLERLAFTCYMVGREDEMVDRLERAHQLHLDAAATLRAAKAAIWIGIDLALRGEAGPASGWFGRAGRLVATHGEPCVEAGYLMIPAIIGSVGAGRYDDAIAAADRAIEVGQAFDEPELVALAMHGKGRALVKLGQVSDGMALLDEAMVSVTADGLAPIVSGIIYCSVIEGCNEVQELRRAHSWTESLVRWCGDQPDLVAFTGQCLTHRAELLQLRGDWDGALAEAERAGMRFHNGMNQHPAARAHYRQGELHRLRGDLEEADAAYRLANQWGWPPLPGLALLLLARGEGPAAWRTLRTRLAETADATERAHLLPALVEASLAVDDLPAAIEAADELTDIGSVYVGTMIAAAGHVARGQVFLASGAPEQAAAELRQAHTAWSELDAPYEVARTQTLLAEAYRALGDTERAALETEAARAVFADLGARPDLARLDRTEGDAGGVLTPREEEVLALVAEGKTNRQIAEELFVSTRTVDRHLSNILTKLGVASRTAAVTHALDRGLL